MEARYSELASLVGEEDARKTPESVLTLIQPTIMMTEQGAMDSGIGELMRQVTGEIDMEAENGMPTEMGQGVGSLMTAGVGQQPTQNFSLGGPVVRMGTGGNPRLEQLSSEILGNYRNIMGDGEDQKKLTKLRFCLTSRMPRAVLRLARMLKGKAWQAYLRLRNLVPQPAGLGGRIGERVGELDKQDRALNYPRWVRHKLNITQNRPRPAQQPRTPFFDDALRRRRQTCYNKYGECGGSCKSNRNG
jgi:hypothetical protein